MRKAYTMLLLSTLVLSLTGCAAAPAADTLAQSTEIPAVSGTFIQPYTCQMWTKEEWVSFYESLKEADIHTLILQWVAETPEGQFVYAAYPSEYAKEHAAEGFQSFPNLLENALSAAQETGMSVFVGLNLADEWWDNPCGKSSWRDAQNAAAQAVAQEIYTLYKDAYPDAFCGWYWAWETYSNAIGLEMDWAKLMKKDIETLDAIDSSMPLLFSPFISKYLKATPEQTLNMWSRYLQCSGVRPGDIFCPQDSIGATGFDLEYIEDRISAMRQAADTVEGLRFWVNCENFQSDYTPAPLARFVSQMQMAAKYAENLVTFSYSEYYSPSSGHPEMHKAYIEYLKTGSVT